MKIDSLNIKDFLEIRRALNNKKSLREKFRNFFMKNGDGYRLGSKTYIAIPFVKIVYGANHKDPKFRFEVFENYEKSSFIQDQLPEYVKKLNKKETKAYLAIVELTL